MRLRVRLSLLLPLLAIALAAAAVTFGVQGTVVWSEVARRVQALQDLAVVNAPAAAAFYVLIYAGLAAFCVPVGPAMSMAGGALLGIWAGTACAVAGATTGAVLLFLFARSTLGTALARRRGVLIARIRPRLERDGFSALLALRLAPVVPSWLLNLAAALTGMRLRPFAVATALGIAPATAVFASAGAGLGDALAHGAPPSLSLIMRPTVLLPLLGLSALALLPIIVRALRDRVGD